MFSANWLIFKIWALFVSKDKNWIDKASILRQVHCKLSKKKSDLGGLQL
jgi:hypothetical protein